MRLRCGIFHHSLLNLKTLYIVWSLVRRRVTRRLTKLQTMCNILKYCKKNFKTVRCGCVAVAFNVSIYLKPVLYTRYFASLGNHRRSQTCQNFSFCVPHQTRTPIVVVFQRASPWLKNYACRIRVSTRHCSNAFHIGLFDRFVLFSHCNII